MVAAQRCHTIVSLVDNSAGDPVRYLVLTHDSSMFYELTSAFEGNNTPIS